MVLEEVGSQRAEEGASGRREALSPFSQQAWCRQREQRGPRAQGEAPLFTFLQPPGHLSCTSGSAPVGWQRQRPQL